MTNETRIASASVPDIIIPGYLNIHFLVLSKVSTGDRILPETELVYWGRGQCDQEWHVESPDLFHEITVAAY